MPQPAAPPSTTDRQRQNELLDMIPKIHEQVIALRAQIAMLTASLDAVGEVH